MVIMTDRPAEPTRMGVGAGPTREYVCPQRDQEFLLPANMRDWLAPGDLALCVLDIVDVMDTRVLHQRPGGCPGRRPYLPEMLLALWLYAACLGVRSSRRIETACHTDAAFRVIAGGLYPDHATLCRFMVDHQDAMHALFLEGLLWCEDAGLIDLSVLAVDGTKIAADAALDRNRTAVWIEAKITEYQAQIALENDSERETEQRELALPGLAAGRVSCSKARLQVLLAARKEVAAQTHAVSAEATERAEAQAGRVGPGRKIAGRKPTEAHAVLLRAEHDVHAARQRLERLEREREHPRPGRQRPRPARIRQVRDTLAGAQDALVAARLAVKDAEGRRRVNLTDPDSRVMSSKDGWVQGYNAQAVANEQQIVLACQVTQDCVDMDLYQPMIAMTARNLTAVGITRLIELVLADAGYSSEANMSWPGPDALIATQANHNQRRAARVLGTAQGPPPDGTAAEQMEHLLRTPQGAQAYGKRCHTIEPIFGDSKINRGIQTFRRRGLPAVQADWTFNHLAGNLLKLFRYRATQHAITPGAVPPRAATA